MHIYASIIIVPLPTRPPVLPDNIVHNQKLSAKSVSLNVHFPRRFNILFFLFTDRHGNISVSCYQQSDPPWDLGSSDDWWWCKDVDWQWTNVNASRPVYGWRLLDHHFEAEQPELNTAPGHHHTTQCPGVTATPGSESELESFEWFPENQMPTDEVRIFMLLHIYYITVEYGFCKLQVKMQTFITHLFTTSIKIM